MPRSSVTPWLVLCGAVGMVLCLRFLLPYVSPFLFALLLAALIDAPVNRLETAGLPRGAAVLFMLGALATALCGTALLLAVNLVQDLLRLADQLPAIGQRVQEMVSQAITWTEHLHAGLPQPLADAMRQSAGKITQGLEALVHTGLAILVGLPGFITSLAVAVLATFFLARDGRLLSHSVLGNLPPQWRTRTARINRAIFAGVVGYVRSQVILMTLSSALSTIGLLLFHVPYAWLLGVVAGILDLLPVVGVGGVFVPLVVGYWLSGRPTFAAGLAAAWGVVLLVRQVCEPALVSAQIGLHPLTSLAAIYIGLEAWGLAGAFLGPVLATSGKVLWLGAIRPMLFDR